MKIKKVISLILSAVMLLSCFSLCSAAGNYYYVVLGDSIAYGSGLLNAREACYGKIIADTCGFDYVNHSVPGATTFDLIYKLNESNVRSDVARADIISISIGGNDFLDELSELMYGAIVEKSYDEYNKIEFGIYSNLSKSIDSIRELNADAVILLQTLYNPQFGYLEEAYQQGAYRVNNAVYRCARENEGVEVVDVASALNGDESNFADDTMHPSAKGNEKIAQEILWTLEELEYTWETSIYVRRKGIDVQLGSGVYAALDHYALSLYAFAKVLEIISVIMG